MREGPGSVNRGPLLSMIDNRCEKSNHYCMIGGT